MRTVVVSLSAVSALLFSALAQAHGGHDAGFWQDLAHHLSEPEHFLVALALGVSAVAWRLSGNRGTGFSFWRLNRASIFRWALHFKG